MNTIISILWDLLRVIEKEETRERERERYTHTHTYTERDLGNIMITYKGTEFFVLVRDSTQFTTTLQAHIMLENLVIVNL